MKKAFTLTEIMLSLAIIGIITTIVLPIFFNTYGNKVSGAQLKKAFVQITNAAQHIMSDEHANDIESLTAEFDNNEGKGFYFTKAGVKTSNATQGAQYFLEKYFKHNDSNCGPSGSGLCVGASYKTPDGVELGAIPSSFYCIKTVNDSAICMRYKESFQWSEILIDVNGSDKPNVTGSDVFVMRITNDGHLSDLYENGAACNKPSGIDEESIMKYTSGCFHKIVSKSWNMREQ